MAMVDHDNLQEVAKALQQCQCTSLNISLELHARGSIEDPCADSLRKAIKANRTINAVRFHLHGDLEEFNNDTRNATNDLVQAFADLPNLKELVVDCEYCPIAAATTLLNKARGLEKLDLTNVRNLAASAPFLGSFWESLENHSTLMRFHLHTHPRSRGAQDRRHVDSLLTALSRAPASLKEVDISMPDIENLTGQPLRTFCASNRFKRLKLVVRGEVGAEGVHALARRNASIQCLTLSCTRTQENTDAIKQLLQRNQTIRNLTLVYHDTETTTSRNNMKDDKFIIEIAQELRTISTLTDFRILAGKLSIGALRAFVETIKSNYSLHHFDFHEKSDKRMSFDAISSMEEGEEKEAFLLWKEIDYYAKLNRNGRGQLLGGDSREQWVAKLIDVNYSIDCLFFFLRSNPILCCESQSAFANDHKLSRKRDRHSGMDNSLCEAVKPCM
jgi:hypothetical protein